jgi:hypothetical protein
MSYLIYKNIEKEILQSENIDVICYTFDNLSKIVTDTLTQYKYTFSDLNKNEKIELLRMNNLNDDDILIGGEVYRLVGDIKSKSIIFEKVDEI